MINYLKTLTIYYIPGFNKKTEDNVFGGGFNYTLTYNIPFLSKKIINSYLIYESFLYPYKLEKTIILNQFPIKYLIFLLGLNPICFNASMFELISQAFVFGKLCLRLSPMD